MSHLIDPDKIVTCPYDSSHKILASKQQNHIIKCKKSHRELDRAMEICPFNALHRFIGSDREKHLSECVDRFRVVPQITAVKCDVSVPLYKRPDDNKHFEDDWDDSDIVTSVSTSYNQTAKSTLTDTAISNTNSNSKYSAKELVNIDKPLIKEKRLSEATEEETQQAKRRLQENSTRDNDLPCTSVEKPKSIIIGGGRGRLFKKPMKKEEIDGN